MRFVLMAAVVLLFSVPAVAPQTTTINVNVVQENKDIEVATEVAAKIGGTQRYAIVAEAGKWEILLDVICQSAVVNDATLGFACHYEDEYDAPQDGELYPLSLNLNGGLTRCTTADTNFCAEQIFDQFVADTQPAKLEAAKAELRQKREIIWMQGWEAGFKAGQAAKKQPSK